MRLEIDNKNSGDSMTDWKYGIFKTNVRGKKIKMMTIEAYDLDDAINAFHSVWARQYGQPYHFCVEWDDMISIENVEGRREEARVHVKSLCSFFEGPGRGRS